MWAKQDPGVENSLIIREIVKNVVEPLEFKLWLHNLLIQKRTQQKFFPHGVNLGIKEDRTCKMMDTVPGI